MSITEQYQRGGFNERLDRIKTGNVLTQIEEAEGTNPNYVHVHRRVNYGHRRRFFALLIALVAWGGIFYILQSHQVVRDFVALAIPEELINPIAKYGGLAVFNYMVMRTVFALKGVGGAPKMVMLVVTAVINFQAFAPSSLTNPEQLWTQHILPMMGGAGALNGFLPTDLDFVN